MSLEAASSWKMTISFVASAFAPGALKTTMPLSEQRSSGMLFVPAPARPMHLSSGQNSVWCRSADRMSSASGVSNSVPTSQPCFTSMSVPRWDIVFIVRILNMVRHLKIFHILRQGLRALERHRVVQRGPHASGQPVPLHVQQAARRRTLAELRIQLL